MRRPDPWHRLIVAVARPPIALWFNWRFEGLEHIPREGPLLVAGNHLSHLDPLAHGYCLVKAGRRPRFLAKSELYASHVMRRVLEGAGHIEVERGTGSPLPVRAALEALRRGECVVVYPEGTLTRNRDFTPMQGRPGLARIALSAGVPVLPVAVWGSQHVIGRGVRSLAFGRPIWVKAGAALDFSDHDERRDEPEALRAVTEAVMHELARLVADLRGRYPRRWM